MPMTDPFTWLLDLLDRARVAVEANAALDWSSEKARNGMVDALRDTIQDKIGDGPPKPPRPEQPLISCSECFVQIRVTKAGRFNYHGPRDDRCPGSGRPVAPVKTLGGATRT